MSFTIANWSCISASLSQVQELVNGVVLNSPNLHTYGSPNDTVAEIEASDYFLPIYKNLSANDLILGSGSDGSFVLRITVSNVNTVTVVNIFPTSIPIPVPVIDGGTGATTAAGARTNLDLGSMALQAASAVAITGGAAVLGSLQAPFTYFAITGDIDILPTNSLTAFEYTTGPTSLSDALGLSHYTDGMTFSLKNTSGSNCTFVPFSGEFIDGNASLTIADQEGYLITKDPTQWSIISKQSLGGGGIDNDGIASAGQFLVSDSTTGAVGTANNGYLFSTGNIWLGGAQAQTNSGINNIGIGLNAAISLTSDQQIAIGYNATTTATAGVAIGSTAECRGFAGFALGYGANTNNDGSGVLCDSQQNNVRDSADDQFVASFTGGFYNYVGTTLSQSIDSAFNFITHKGVSDQSYSLQVVINGFNITIGAGVQTLLLNPSTTLPTGIVTTPVSPIDGQIIRVGTTHTITALTVSPSGGQTIVNPPTTLGAGQGFELQYNSAGSKWFTLYQGGNPTVTWLGSGTEGSVIGGDLAGTNAGAACLLYSTNSSGSATIDNASVNSFAFGDAVTMIASSNTFLFGSQGTSSTASNSFGFGPFVTLTGNNQVGIGNAVTVLNAGSWVIGDSNATGPLDTAPDQFNSSFAGGYNFYINSSGLLASGIDANANAITYKGTADQSYSLQAPSTGFSITIGAGVKTLLLNPAGTLLAGAVIMPAAPIDGQEIRIASDQTITTLTISPNSGQSLANSFVTGLTAGTGVGYIYNLSATTWYRIY